MKRELQHEYHKPDMVRPGWVIYGLLTSSIELIPGVFIKDANVAELWCGYKRQIYLANYEKQECDIQQGMSLVSFRYYLRMAHDLRLIRELGIDPPEYSLYADSLRYMTDDDMFVYGPAMRRRFKITPVGFGSTKWSSLKSFYQEKHSGKKHS